MTRAHPRLATELVEGLRSDILAYGQEIWSSMPGHTLVSFDEAVDLALREEEQTLTPRSRLFERALRRLAST